MQTLLLAASQEYIVGKFIALYLLAKKCQV